MIIIDNFDNFPSIDNPVVTIGSFDGVHLGHRQIFRQLNEYARKIQGNSVVITFDKHPQLILNPRSDFFQINTLEENIRLIEKENIDYLIIIHFTAEFSQLTSRQFFKEYLVQKIGTKALVLGPNHTFGNKREGTIHSISELCKEYKITMLEIPEFVLNNNKVRSAQIRKMLLNKDIEQAEVLLGHPLNNKIQ